MQSTMIMSALANSAMGNNFSEKAAEALMNGEMVETSANTLENVINSSPDPVRIMNCRKPIQQVRDGKKIGRNDPCPCGAVDEKTGKPKKFKHCCMNKGEYNQLVDKY